MSSYRQRAAKIIATVGPATQNATMLNKLFEAGVNVFRLNMSHLSHEKFIDVYNDIRALEKNKNTAIGILVDLQGPKLRIGDVQEGVIIEKGASFSLDNKPDTGTSQRVFLPHQEIFSAVKPNDLLLIDDGKIVLRTVRVQKDTIETVVKVGGPLLGKKGVALPNRAINLDPLTPKDKEDLAHVLKFDIDWIALSFVQRAADLDMLRDLTHDKVAIMAKIEKPQALEVLEDIIKKSDGLMIARGDLGVELPLSQVPGWQKRITIMARKHGKPVVVATQMLESMTSIPTPTRAEVSDVAQAVFDGVDAVMLSAETASGAFPEQSVQTMAHIIRDVERDPLYSHFIDAFQITPEKTNADAISAAAHSMINALPVSCLVCYTNSGATGQRMARERPRIPLIALTNIIQTARRLAVVWGLSCILIQDPKDIKDMIEQACSVARNEKKLKAGDILIVTAGIPLGTPGATNLLRIIRLEE